MVTSSFARFNAAKTQLQAVYQELKEDHLLTKKTTHCFSMMAHDHGHEQLNAVLKGNNGIIDFI